MKEAKFIHIDSPEKKAELLKEGYKFFEGPSILKSTWTANLKDTGDLDERRNDTSGQV